MMHLIHTAYLTGELGCGTVKLADWENLAEIHEATTLLDGRKQTATK